MMKVEPMQLVKALGQDASRWFGNSWQRILDAKPSTDTPEGAATCTARFSLQKQLCIGMAVFREIVVGFWAGYHFVLACCVAAWDLFMMPLVPILSSCLFWKDADWGTFTSRDDAKYWKGKVVWITGASSGVGAQLARALAKRGVGGLILSGRNPAALEMLMSTILAMGHLKESDLLLLPMELSNLDTIPSAVERAVAFKGKVHMLFNNAGILAMEPVIDTAWETTEDVLRVNLMAPIRLTQELLPHMQTLSTTPPATRGESNACHIVFTNSINAMLGLPCHAAYGASKQGLCGYARTLAGEVTAVPVASATERQVELQKKEPDNFVCRGVRMLLNAMGGGANEVVGDIAVTSVYGGAIQTELTAKRVDSKQPRVPGIRGPLGSRGPTGGLKPILAESRRGMQPQRFAELMLVAVSNHRREAWIATVPDMLWASLLTHAPDLADRLRRIMETGFYKKFVTETEEKEAPRLAAPEPTTTNGSQNQTAGNTK